MANGHNIYIWDVKLYGTPKSLDEALEMVVILSEEISSFPMSQEILAFGRDVTKYINLDNMSGILPDFINCEADVRSTKTAAYCFYLPEYNWRSLFKILLKVAQKYNLVLVDQRMPLVLLPDGFVLTSHGDQIYWSDFLDDEYGEDSLPETITEFHQLLKTHVDKLLGAHNFVLEPNDSDDLNALDDDEIYIKYSRKISSGNHYIALGCRGGDGNFKLQLFFQIIEKNMIKIATLSDFEYPIDVGGGCY